MEDVEKICIDNNKYGKRILQCNVQILLKKHNINHYSTYSIIKASNDLIVLLKIIIYFEYSKQR